MECKLAISELHNKDQVVSVVHQLQIKEMLQFHQEDSSLDTGIFHQLAA
jgi:hypothetical protein